MSCGVGRVWVVENEWLCPTYGEFGTQKKVMWNCTICSSCGSAVLYFKNLPLTHAAALLLFFSFMLEEVICLYGATWRRGVNLD